MEKTFLYSLNATDTENPDLAKLQILSFVLLFGFTSEIASFTAQNALIIATVAPAQLYPKMVLESLKSKKIQNL